MPTDSTNSPSAVLRVSSQEPRNSAATTNSENGRMMKPLPRYANASLKMMILMELVLSWAIPLPAIIRISVATIGCIRT